MFSFRTVLLLFVLALVAIFGSTNGEPACDPSTRMTEMADEQTRASSESADRMNRITLSCETSTSTGGGGNSGFAMIIDLSVGFFFLIWVAIGIWVVCVKRQKAMNAAAIQPYSGEVGAKEMGYGNGMDGKTEKVFTSAPAGKLSNGDTNV